VQARALALGSSGTIRFRSKMPWPSGPRKSRNPSALLLAPMSFDWVVDHKCARASISSIGSSSSDMLLPKSMFAPRYSLE